MLNDIKKYCDFEGWVIKYGCVSINGKIYQTNSIRSDHGMIVPLCWSHKHDDATSILGYALLENRDEGVYAYCKLHDHIGLKDTINSLIHNRGSVSLSPFITQVKFEDKYIVQGVIREVSLVLARVDPDECYYPVPNELVKKEA